MNEKHLLLCSSPEWAKMIEQEAIPWVLDGVDLGDDLIEVGPGPGAATDVLRHRVKRLTAVEYDQQIATALAARMAGTNVDVVRADATRLPFDDARFSGAASFTMLHHVPTEDLQNMLFAELRRVLRPGAALAGSDSLDSPEFRELHENDVCTPLNPATLAGRLHDAGFAEVDVETHEVGAIRFVARTPRH